MPLLLTCAHPTLLPSREASAPRAAEPVPEPSPTRGATSVAPNERVRAASPDGDVLCVAVTTAAAEDEVEEVAPPNAALMEAQAACLEAADVVAVRGRESTRCARATTSSPARLPSIRAAEARRTAAKKATSRGEDAAAYPAVGLLAPRAAEEKQAETAAEEAAQAAEEESEEQPPEPREIIIAGSTGTHLSEASRLDCGSPCFTK